MSEQPRILFFDDIDSTNAEARRLAEAGETGPLWITALRQHQGRGRRGRAWETGEGNLAATHLFTTTLPPAQAAQVSFVAALAVADLIDAFSRERASLKWPNDPLIGGRKAAGILVESGALDEGVIWLAVGCGVNLARAPAQSERPVTALADHMEGPPPTPREALLVLASAMESWRGLWEASGFAPIAEAWTRRAHGLGGPCVAHLSTETVRGVAEGLDPDGALRLRLPTGEVRRITAGDVFF
ncbi:MAG TPA: biotin--[acetyl-CoA-carboxylase] ligase [Caulobacteraceae bacterium]|nr:biotin--[acetyl-CoA-carboxylase] ligase [Caulobacteraceae bacterium]